MKNLFENTKTAFLLKNNRQLLRAYLLFSILKYRFLVKVLSSIALFFSRFRSPFNPLIKISLFDHFCGGTTLKSCWKKIEEMKSQNVHSILDFSVEAHQTEKHFEDSVKKKLLLINAIKNKKAIPFSVFKPTCLGRYDLFKKKSDNIKFTPKELIEWNKIIDRFDRVCNESVKQNIRVLIDAEEKEVQGAIDQLALKMMEKYNHTDVFVYNTVQMYRHDRLFYLKNLIKQKTENFILGIKLVRGAYMEKERVIAKKNNTQSPICKNKKETDNNYDLAIDFLFDNLNKVNVFIATHNEKSTLKVLELMKIYKLENTDKRIWFGQLYGMSDQITFNLAKKEYNVAKIVPFGPINNLIPYLIRRAQENSSVVGQSNRELLLIKVERKRRKENNA